MEQKGMDCGYFTPVGHRCHCLTRVLVQAGYTPSVCPRGRDNCTNPNGCELCRPSGSGDEDDER